MGTLKSHPIFAKVVLDSAIDRPLDYKIPPSLQGKIQVGMRVKIPLKNQEQKGIVVSLEESSPFKTIKPIISTLSDLPLIPPDLFSLANWIANYYCAPLRKVLKTILPPSLRSEMAPKTQLFIVANHSQNTLKEHAASLRSSHPAQAAVLDQVLLAPKGLLLTKLLEQTKTSRSPVETLVKKKILSTRLLQIDRDPLLDMDYFRTEPKKLNEEQAAALQKIEESLETGFKTHLIHGITGSGKTEVYLQAIDRALKKNKGVIFLVPEIALTMQTTERLCARFGNGIAIIHHRLSPGERYDTWNKILSGKIQIVLGARSAIFAPVKNLGLIIVDEEHESSYKQGDEAPRYHGRDVAVIRGKLTESTVLLGSATPSLESFHNVHKKKYSLISLLKRADRATLPKVHIVDMRSQNEKNKGFTLFSDPLLQAIKKRLPLGEQTLLFLNRRGFYPYRLCTSCNHKVSCPNCEVSLTFHLGENILSCHLCNYTEKSLSKKCPKCNSPDTLKFRGAGTEQVEKTLKAIFPTIRTLRLDADTTKHKGSHEMLFKQFRAGKADVLIGTQMIAKGLHFPSVTLVGVLSADSALNIPDFRASEGAFQLITQVAGRSGRGEIPGEVFIQTSLPENPIIQFGSDQDYLSFYNHELEGRKIFSYPPFAQLIKISVSGPSLDEVVRTITYFRSSIIKNLPPSFEIHPPIPCGYAKIKNLYRYQFLIKGEKIAAITPIIKREQEAFPLKKDVRLSIDIDPSSTFF